MYDSFDNCFSSPAIALFPFSKIRLKEFINNVPIRNKFF